METEEGLSLYSCTKCRVYFEAYSQAFTHLKVKHDLKVESLESTAFPKCYISLERSKNIDKNVSSSSSSSVTVVSPSTNNRSTGLKRDIDADETDGNKTITENEPSLRIRTRTPKKRNPPGRVSTMTDGDDNGGRVEIKLDNLKASEIETLMQDLFQPKGGGTRNSSRRTRKPKYNPAIYSVGAKSDSDSDYEEVRKSSSSSSEDEEDIDSDSDNPSPKTTQGQKKKVRILRHKCPKCGKPFEFPYEVRRHLRTHEPHKKRSHRYAGPKKAYACPLCDGSYDMLPSLRNHFIVHLENNPFVCKMSGCNGARFQNRKSLKRHMDLHIGEKRYKCNKCNYAYVRRYSLLQHLKRCGKVNMKRKQIHIIKRVETEIDDTAALEEPVNRNGSIDTTTPSPTDYQNLKINVTDEEDEEDEFLKIEVGSQHFDDTGIADLSSENEEGGQNEQEPQIQDLMPSEHYNSQSLRDITLKDPVYLKLLSENPKAAALVLPRYDKSSSLEIKGKEIFKCSLCSWEGAMIQNFRAHMKIVHNQDLEKSSLITFSESASSGSSSGVTLLCGKCGYSCPSSDDLAEHMNKEHPGIGKHRCSHCGIFFTDVKALNKHEQRVHLSSEKKHQCSQCPAKYSLLTSLKNHIDKKHGPPNDAEKFTCHKCKIQFDTRPLLNAHQLAKHRMNSVQCKLCGTSSYNKYSLERHIRIVHLGIKGEQYGTRKQLNQESSSVPASASSATSENEKANDNDQEILGF